MSVTLLKMAGESANIQIIDLPDEESDEMKITPLLVCIGCLICFGIQLKSTFEIFCVKFSFKINF